MRVRIVGQMDEVLVGRIVRDFPEVVLVAGASNLEGSDEPLDAILGWEASPSEVVGALREARSVRWVHSNAAGVHPILLEGLIDQPTILTNGSGAQAPAMAEYVVLALLTFLKRSREIGRLQERSEWASGFRIAELGSLTVGIIGLGEAGGAIARLLRPFGVRLLGIRRQPTVTSDVDEVYPREDLPRFLAQLDALVLAAPLTAETRGMIGAAELGHLRPGAYLVNVARGPIVDEPALLAALGSGHLAGAALDVFAEEPLPSTSPFWTMPNVIVSPHYCDQTPETDERGRVLVLDNLRRFLQGEPLRNVVNRDLGY